MTNIEVIKYLIPPVATSTRPSAEYLKQKEAYDLAIKALEDRLQGEWISVSDRLPDERQVVIVTDDRGRVFEYELNPLDVDKYTMGKWRYLGHEIIAWQPLPEPYRKGGYRMNLPKTFNEHSLGDFIVDDNGISKIVSIDPDYSSYTSELILPKDVFVEAFNKYIKGGAE